MDRKCAKLGNRATKKERAEAHRAKLEIKELEREDFEEARPFVFANQSSKHPEYGERPAEQTRRMLEKDS